MNTSWYDVVSSIDLGSSFSKSSVRLSEKWPSSTMEMLYISQAHLVPPELAQEQVSQTGREVGSQAQESKDYAMCCSECVSMQPWPSQHLMRKDKIPFFEMKEMCLLLLTSHIPCDISWFLCFSSIAIQHSYWLTVHILSWAQMTFLNLIYLFEFYNNRNTFIWMRWDWVGFLFLSAVASWWWWWWRPL